MAESRRSSRVTSRPSSPGRPRSRTTRSGRPLADRVERRRAVARGQHREARVLEVVAGELAIFGSSSTTRMVFIGRIVEREAPPADVRGRVGVGKGTQAVPGRPGRVASAGRRRWPPGSGGASHRTRGRRGSRRASVASVRPALADSRSRPSRPDPSHRGPAAAPEDRPDQAEDEEQEEQGGEEAEEAEAGIASRGRSRSHRRATTTGVTTVPALPVAVRDGGAKAGLVGGGGDEPAADREDGDEQDGGEDAGHGW